MSSIVNASPVAAPLGLVNLNPATVPLVVKGASGQGANLQEWQNSSGAVITRIASDASIVTSTNIACNIIFPNQLNISNSVATNVAAIVKAAPSQTADLQQWQSSTGTVLASVRGTDGAVLTPVVGSVGGSNVWLSFSTNNIVANTVSPSTTPFQCKGAASQTADLQQWQSSTGSVLASVGPTGAIGIGQAADQSYSIKATGVIRGVSLTADTISTSGNAADQVKLTVIGGISQTSDLQRWTANGGGLLARVDSSGAIAPQNGARITSGSGAPTTPGGINPTAGDVYHRKDTPGVAMQNIYKCTVGGATPTWVALV